MWCMKKSYHVSYTFKKRTIEKPSLHVIRSKNLKKANRKSQGTDGWSMDVGDAEAGSMSVKKTYIDDVVSSRIPKRSTGQRLFL